MAATNLNDGSSWARWFSAQLNEHGWHQAEFVRQADGAVSRAQVSRWLGGATPDLDGVLAACRVLDVPVTDFLVAAGYVDADRAGIVVQRRNTAALSKTELLAAMRELLTELDRRIPDDVSGERPTPSTVEQSPTRLDDHRPKRLRPRGEEGADWAADRPQL